MPNFCVNCKHFWQADDDDARFRWSIDKSRCLFVPEGAFNLVTGEPFVKNSTGVSCYDFRFDTVMIANMMLSCGSEGKYFEKSIDTIPD